MIATNGDYFKDVDQIDRLYNAGLNQLQVNVYSNVKRYRVLKQMLLQSIAEEGNIYNKATPKKRLYSIEMKFDKKLTPSSTKIGRFELSNRSGHIPSLGGLKEPLKKMCVRPFRYMQVNWKGEVILCCNDYLGEVVCGNIAFDPVDVIWEESKILREYRQKLIFEDRSGLHLCAPCSFGGGAYPHMVPKFWPELLK
jgi:MoaA/NifB/PqqE/SkfB family radical SAM enzyme